MNHREPPHLPAGVRRALHCLSLLLLPALAPEGTQTFARTRPASDSGIGRPADEPLPYLQAIGAPPLRFQENAPPLELVTRPAAAAPPVPALSPTESTVALANAAAAQTAAIEAMPHPAEPKANPVAAEPAAPATKTPAPILPDDARPAIHPEDFLPYFQIPGSARKPGDVMIVAPAAGAAPSPGAIPPSSATYTQTPK